MKDKLKYVLKCIFRTITIITVSLIGIVFIPVFIVCGIYIMLARNVFDELEMSI